MLLDHSSDVTLIYKIAEEEKSEKNTPSNSFTEEEFTNDVQHQFLFLAPAEAKQVNTTYQLKLQSAYIDISPPPPDVIS